MKKMNKTEKFLVWNQNYLFKFNPWNCKKTSYALIVNYLKFFN